MKRIYTFLLLFLSVLTLKSIVILNGSSTDITEISGARFYTEEVLEVNRLDYGVVHTLSRGFTSTSMSGYDADGYGGYNTPVVPGKFYPQQVNVIEVPSSSGVKIVNWANLNNHKWTLTTIRNLIKDYEQKHPGWRIVAAVNGDFFDINGTGNLPYQTSNSVINEGEFYKATTGSNVGIKLDGSTNTLIGGNPTRKQYMTLAVYDHDDNIINEFNIEKINTAPGAGETSVYYANYNADKVIVPINVNVGSNNGYFVDSAELALPNSSNSFYGKGIITSTASKSITTGQFAIVTNEPSVNAALAVGVKIRAQWEYSGAYAGIQTVAGCGTTIMTNQVVNGSAGLADRAPRTVIGRKADGTIVMMVVDGRQADDDMYGADRTELAAIMKSYGAVDAYNLDGGGSSTTIVRKGDDIVVMNSPSDGRERSDANALLIATRDPELDYQIIEKTETSLTIKADVLNNYVHDIDKLYVRVNMQTKEVVNGEVSFTGLRANREYKVEFFYRTSSNILYQIVKVDNQWTLKRIPEFFKVTLLEEESTFTFTPIMTDPDNATNLLSATIYVNGNQYQFTNGELTLNKEDLISSIDEVILEYTYNLGDNDPKTFRIVNPHFYSTMTLNIIVDNQEAFVVGIYK